MLRTREEAVSRSTRSRKSSCGMRKDVIQLTRNCLRCQHTKNPPFEKPDGKFQQVRLDIVSPPSPFTRVRGLFDDAGQIHLENSSKIVKADFHLRLCLNSERIKTRTKRIYSPSVSLARPPVGWHRIVEHPAQTTTPWAWLKTVVIL